MNKMMIDVKGEAIEVMKDVFGTCPKCKNDTYGENERVYADDPYAVEICPNCGWWANTVTSSDDEEEAFEMISSIEVNEEKDACESLDNLVDRYYSQIYYDTYGFEFDEEDPIKEEVLKKAFNKACYDLDINNKSFDVKEVCDEPYLKITNFILMAIVPIDDVNVAVYNEVITDYNHSCPSHIMED